MANTKVLTFAGEHLDTIFVNDLDTKHLQYALEQIDVDSYELTIAAINDKQKRTEYVLTVSSKELKALVSYIMKTFESNKKRRKGSK